ncbi:DUF2851 family protein [Flavobacterium sp. AG291]|uniref:DUF2851 family protein n=1 Tax=Flavobacterium sp. AG291 TaxID=2184000 RepID=UPI000E0B0141|nr:DUF2851 family protein [Flavobacterium sp. AG291]RDI16065.1 uncharacterized protein DUF2851 [Flavobacterium sp. AG291]
MKEDFLHYVWQFKKFDTLNLKTVQGEDIVVVNTGQYLQLAGPDFFNAQLAIGSQKWAGNVEIHIKSSDWYHHSHEKDTAYDNVILHVVWEHDTEVFRKDNTEIPVFELKHYVSAETLNNYNNLAVTKSWIYCEKELAHVDAFMFSNWKERLFFERLERKALPILELAKATGNDWEAVLFSFLAKSFGLNTNGEIFYRVVQSLPFSVIRREGFEFENLEALFFGRVGLLEDNHEDLYFKDLKSRYDYICHKYRLDKVYVDPVQFFKHRPDNFPTIRLSQLAQLYHKHQNLFSKLTEGVSVEQIYNIFDIQVSPYWQTHYTFDKVSTKKRKSLTTSFVDLLIVNTIVPFRFAYERSIGKEDPEKLIAMLQAIKPEKNAIIDKFTQFNVEMKSAFDTQSLLQLKNEYCANKRCLQCAVGLELLKK